MMLNLLIKWMILLYKPIARFLKSSASIINVMREYSVYNECEVELRKINKLFISIENHNCVFRIFNMKLSGIPKM